MTLATDISKHNGEVRHLVVANPVIYSPEVIQVKHLQDFWRDEQGAELAEYAVGTAILVAVAIIVYKVLGDAVNVKMSTVANEVQK